MSGIFCSLRQLSVTYRRGKNNATALDRIDLDIAAGEAVLLVQSDVERGFAEAESDGIVQVSTGGAEYASGPTVKDMVLGAQALAGQVVEPDGDAGVCEGLEPFVHDQFSWMSGSGVSWAQLIVTPGWASTSAGPLGPLAAGCVGAVVPVDASRLSCAAVTTVSGVKPNFSNNKLPAALAP